jgi:hypothetical protein
MKRLIGSSLLLIALMGVNAWADDSNVSQRRVTCDSVSSLDPYISIRGTLRVDDSGDLNNAQGTLRMDFGGANRIFVAVRGQYLSSYDNIEFADLQPLSFGDYGIDQIYIDFKDGVFQAGSYVSFMAGGFYKMSCYTTP